MYLIPNQASASLSKKTVEAKKQRRSEKFRNNCLSLEQAQENQ